MNNNNKSRWKDCPLVYPSFEEIVAALQDQGKQDTVKKKGKDVPRHKYPLIEKLGAKIFGLIQQNLNPEGLTKNIHRGKIPLYTGILLARNHVDVCNLKAVFHQYQAGAKVYVVQVDPIHAGIDICIERFQCYIENQINQKNSARTCNDGLCLASILLESQYRASVSGIMSRKKDRKKSDISGDAIKHFFELVLTDSFLNPSYQVSPPPSQHYDMFPQEEKANWGPNSTSIFEHNRDAEWLRQTWDNYIKPKYKKALDRWNKDTGRGDGTSPSFIDYCAGDRWLVYVFCKDEQANFLLAHSAGGRMPAHLQFESGFEDVSTISGSNATSPNSAKRKELEDELTAIKRQRAKIEKGMERVFTFIEKYNKSGSKDDQLPRQQQNNMDKQIQQVANYSKLMVDNEVLGTMSPASQKVFKESLIGRRRSLLEKMKKSSDNN